MPFYCRRRRRRRRVFRLVRDITTAAFINVEWAGALGALGALGGRASECIELAVADYDVKLHWQRTKEGEEGEGAHN